MRIYLPWGPSVNDYYGRSKSGHVYLHARVKKFRLDVLRAVNEHEGSQVYNGQMGMLIELFPPSKIKYDIDNRCKGILDALEHAGVYPDDSMVMDMRVLKRDKVKFGQIIVTITELTKIQEVI